ncbi:MAG TPA: capsule assembly Wzi family protein [Mucilaginibacter sp.]|nr:capsule assembly Wzi family protein [Mucilaginibacter sp.]
MNTKAKILLPFLSLVMASSAFAQTVPVGSLSIEDAYRRQQLLGKIDSSVSFTIRPLYPAAAFEKDNVFDPDGNLPDAGLLNNNGIYKTWNDKGLLQILPVTWMQQYNTHNPYGWNDGAMIPAAGYQTLLSAGVYFKYRFFSIQFAPEFVFAQNKNFDGFTQADNGSAAFKAWYKVYNYTDLPERFGTGAYNKLLPGQSSIRFTFDPVSFGLSTENLWWGPGIQNSLTMSNTAQGFAHLTLNTTRPVKTPIGSFETQIIAGKLTSSGHSPLVLGQPGNMDALYQPKSDDWRYLSGWVFSYQPKWVPGLFLGISRTFTVYHNNLQHTLKGYIPVLTSFFKDNYYDPVTGINQEDASQRDQIASLFARWLWTGANAEIYVEYGREDHNWDPRDLLLDPEHSRAYIIGFKKLFKTGSSADEYIQVGVEETQLAKPTDDLINRNTTPGWYASSQVRAGYTNNGEVLGAGIGPGGGLQTLDVSWLKGAKRLGIQIGRYEHNQDYYWAAFPAGEVRRHWVDYTFGLSGECNYNHFIFSAGLLYARELNYQWKFKNDPDQFYFDQINYDANNFKLNVGVMYRF